MSEEDPRQNLTQMLNAWSAGDDAAGSQVVEQVYGELRRMAAKQMAQERSDHTLQATALVHEIYLRLADLRSISWDGRAHFFGSVAHLIRRVLVDHARRLNAAKRGDGVKPVSLDESQDLPIERPAEMLSLHDALERLEAEDAELAAIVMQRFFGGLSGEEIADLLGKSPATIKRKWRIARAWLYRAMRESAIP